MTDLPSWQAIQDKWQAKWWEAKIHHANRDESAPKPTYFIHFAYPGISGYLHVGHMRGFTYSDVFARYKKMQGYDVLFPAGFHASGIPAVAFARDVERGEKTEYLRRNGYTGDIAALTDSRNVVDYFAQVYTYEYWKKFGFLIDERRNCTTIDDGYKRFIQWQFRRLNDLGYLVTKPHHAPYCPVQGPVAVDKSETDIKQGGSAEIQEFTLVEFEVDASKLKLGAGIEKLILPCATLRPETLFGVTNLWLNPTIEYEVVRVWRDGAVADSDPTKWFIAATESVRKLEWQFERAEATGIRFLGSKLVGFSATNSIAGTVPVIASSFVSAKIATGVVMSVPAHAPFDFMALKEHEELGVVPKQIITIEGYTGLPAEFACAQHGVTKLADVEALDAATTMVYGDEFNKGVLNDSCGEYAGKRVRVAKDEIKLMLLESGQANLLREFNELVISRAGEEVGIRRVPNQVFIGYSDPEWTAKAQAYAKTMQIHPQRYADDVTNVLQWFGDRACVRRGAWLGTNFPLDPEWIIEPIADSTFYSWFYLVSPYINSGEIPIEELTDEFFDYTINGRGNAAKPIWETVRKDVQYFGPVDVNLGGKEHQTVHFPVYIMNNIALLDDSAMLPRGIFVNWWVTQKAGTKISKSKGGAEPIPGAMASYGVDSMRLYYCHVGSPHADIEWDPELVNTYKEHLERLLRSIMGWLESTTSESGPMDKWLEASTSNHVATVLEAYEGMDLRGAATEILYNLPESIRHSVRRGGMGRAQLAATLQQLALFSCPIVPHLAEELMEMIGAAGIAVPRGLVSTMQLPIPAVANVEILATEQYVLTVIDDIRTVAKLAGPSTSGEATLYVSPAWKSELMRTALGLVVEGQKFPMGDFMSAVMANPEMRQMGKAVQQFTGKIPGDIPKLSSHQKLVAGKLSELEILRSYATGIAAQVGLNTIHVYAADDPDAPEHAKRNLAGPLKPGIVWV